LERQGKVEEARRLHEKAQALGESIERSLDRGDRRREILEGLERGIEALERLGRHEEARHLREIAEQVRRGEDQEYARRTGELFDYVSRRDDPRAAAKRTLEVLRWAVRILATNERADAADLVERAEYALRLRMEGRDDPEARRVQAGAPSRENLAEALLLAERLLREAGRAENAEAVENIVRALLRKPERRDRERDERQEMILHRLHELEAQMAKLEREIEHLRYELERRGR
jgi:hypothetical protein